MTEYTIRYAIVRREESESLYGPATAAAMAGIDLRELELYRREGLVRPRQRGDGTQGYALSDIREMSCIARLQREVELDLAAVEVVLHLRAQVFEAHREIRRTQETFLRREQELLQTIDELRRRFSAETRWR